MTVETASTNGTRRHRGCPAPKPLGSTCGHRLEAGAEHCREHEGTDPRRRCAAKARPRDGQLAPCQAWPLAGLPFCDDHDPVRVEYRRLERVSVQARAAQTSHLLASAAPASVTRAVEWLVLADKVSLADLAAALRQYGMPAAGPPRP